MPECDRAFTRSDALAKHMRTVHETEALRPSDPVPKHHSSFPANKLQRVRLVFNSSATKSGKASPISASSALGAENPHNFHAEDGSVVSSGLGDGKQLGQGSHLNANTGEYALHNRKLSYPSDLLLTVAEANLPSDQLFQILRQQKVWSDIETANLKREVAKLEAKCQEEWVAKELVLENVMEAEYAVENRKALRRRRKSEDGRERNFIRDKMLDDVRAAVKLNIHGKAPWWRSFNEPQELDIDNEYEDDALPGD